MRTFSVSEVNLLKKIVFWLFFNLIVINLFTVSCFGEELKIPMLMYHNINDDYNIKDRTVEMSKNEFVSQMKAIKEEGYETISFYEYIDYVNGKAELPEKPIIITFDDGYLNNYTVAFPILKEMNMKATIFIITGRMGMQNGVKYPHFTWQQAKEMEESGLIDIESHTNFHNELDKISNLNVIYELRKSKYLIDRHLGKNTSILAYPYGYYNDAVIKAAESAGYLAAVRIRTEKPGVNTKNQGVYELKRITAYGGMSGQDMIDSINYNMAY